MKKIPTSEILRIKEKSFEEAWKYGGELLNDGSIYDLRRIEQTPSRGAPHVPANDLIEKMRQRLLELGFDEVINETIFPEADVMKQWGLDRFCYTRQMLLSRRST